MKTLLRYLSKKVDSIPLRFMIGAMYGNLELYGYLGTGAMCAKVIYSHTLEAIHDRRNQNKKV